MYDMPLEDSSVWSTPSLCQVGKRFSALVLKRLPASEVSVQVDAKANCRTVDEHGGRVQQCLEEHEALLLWGCMQAKLILSLENWHAADAQQSCICN